MEAIYEKCLCIEFDRRGIHHERQVPVPVVYRGVPVGVHYRLDLLVEKALVVELKVSEANTPVYRAQVLTYLRLMDCRLGLLINFGMATVRDGIERVVNGL